MVTPESTIHEVDFCAQVAAATNVLVSQNPEAFPFREARVESFGAGPLRRKRRDLCFFGPEGKLLLCGEVKMPGTPEGHSPYDEAVCTDASRKADNAGVQFFFTWNVKTFVLWDRSLWDRPLLERRVWERTLPRNLATSADVARPENLEFIKTHFLPDLLRDLGDLLSGRRRDWLPPDDIFIRSLESHLEWPVQLLARYVLEESERSRSFDLQVQQWLTAQDRTFVRTPHEEWVKAADNMARTLAYIWANRLIFYKALRSRFPDLPRLELRASVKKPQEALAAFNDLFRRGVERSGDYEPLLMPGAKDWAALLVFQPGNALEAWRGLLRGLESVDFRAVSSDVVGRIFQKLIGPDERHRFGQHFTGDDVVDLINGFCIREAGAAVLDPACGSGSFLVRAYYRKRHLDPRRSHLDLLAELFGCDIAPYPAHLATLNLAAREINDEANYPRVARRNFFDFVPPAPFCEVPDRAGRSQGLALPALDAVVGNPPYVRQEKVGQAEKARYAQLVQAAWPGLFLTGRSDLHCYFWPAAARLLKPRGYFGFLTSSSWLDVEYGFALQGWLLRHFRVLAVMESAAEPWFEDARVKTCVTIAQRCDDEAERLANRVRFVRFARPLAEVIGVPPGSDEGVRQAAIDALRENILATESDRQDEQMRIIVKLQGDLWNDGVRAGEILHGVEVQSLAEEYENGEEEEAEQEPPAAAVPRSARENGDYHAGKWGRYVRAPDLYFEIMRRYGARFVALGEIASVRFGVKTGCDAFFMPTDVTARMLKEHSSERAFREHAGGAPRKDVQSGKLKMVKAGDGSVHPIESKYLAPELHSPMEIFRPVVHSKDLDRRVLLVREPLYRLKRKAPWVWRYLRYGAHAQFASSKSKPVPIQERSTCAARARWYDLTNLVRPGFAFWPMAQQYRHIIPANPERLICNHNLFDLAPCGLSAREAKALVALLNSTLVGLFKTFYGRFAGTEGNLKTEVVDVDLLQVPDPRRIPEGLAKRLSAALKSMSGREVGRLVEEQLMACHTPELARKLAAGPVVLPDELRQPDRRALDDAVFEWLGVSEAADRATLVDRLYEATARHFRDLRVVEIEKMLQRGKTNHKRFNLQDLAADIWDAAELPDHMPLAEWVRQQSGAETAVTIPEDRPVTLEDNSLLGEHTVYFGKERKTFIACASSGKAQLVAHLSEAGLSGDVMLPEDPAACAALLGAAAQRLGEARARFTELAASRTGDERVQKQLLETLKSWFVQGREEPRPSTLTALDDE